MFFITVGHNLLRNSIDQKNTTYIKLGCYRILNIMSFWFPNITNTYKNSFIGARWLREMKWHVYRPFWNGGLIINFSRSGSMLDDFISVKATIKNERIIFFYYQYICDKVYLEVIALKICPYKELLPIRYKCFLTSGCVNLKVWPVINLSCLIRLDYQAIWVFPTSIEKYIIGLIRLDYKT